MRDMRPPVNCAMGTPAGLPVSVIFLDTPKPVRVVPVMCRATCVLGGPAGVLACTAEPHDVRP